jgi:hypothetical protein
MAPSKYRYAILSCLTSIVIGAAVIAAQNSLADFGVTEARLKPGLVNAFVYGNLPLYPSKKVYSAASPTVRAAFVKNALGWVKTYTESAAFKADYDKRRAEAKPTLPASKGTPDEQYTKYLEDQKKSIVDMKANVAKMSPDMQKQMQPIIQQAQASMEKMSKDPQTAAIMKQSYVQDAETTQKNYQHSVAEYDAKFPADSRVLIAKRLRDFLEMSRDVAFDAKLANAGGGIMRFADPNLESKSDQWKLCFRAGKEPVDAARAFAMDWLKQLGVK